MASLSARRRISSDARPARSSATSRPVVYSPGTSTLKVGSLVPRLRLSRFESGPHGCRSVRKRRTGSAQPLRPASSASTWPGSTNSWRQAVSLSRCTLMGIACSGASSSSPWPTLAQHGGTRSAPRAVRAPERSLQHPDQGRSPVTSVDSDYLLHRGPASYTCWAARFTCRDASNLAIDTFGRFASKTS